MHGGAGTWHEHTVRKIDDVEGRVLGLGLGCGQHVRNLATDYRNNRVLQHLACGASIPRRPDVTPSPNPCAESPGSLQRHAPL